MRGIAWVLLLLFCTACVPQGGGMSREESALQKARSRRAMSTRMFDTQDRKEMLAASAGVLQDLGYIINESDERLGLLVGHKERSAVDTKDLLVSSLFAILATAATDRVQQPHYDDKQQIHASLTVRSIPTKKQMEARITFYRIVWRTDGHVRTELMEDSQMYQKFFGKLSKSLFLEEHKI